MKRGQLTHTDPNAFTRTEFETGSWHQ
jgi:hypothetical protein